MDMQSPTTLLYATDSYVRAFEAHVVATEGQTVALDQTAFPDAMGERVYYRPVERGLEIKLKEKLDRLREARVQARRASGRED